MVEKKESFDEKCRRLGLFDKFIEDIIDMIAEKNREIERLRKAVDSAYLDVYQTAWMESWDTAALAMEEEITKHLIYGDMGEKEEAENERNV